MNTLFALSAMVAALWMSVYAFGDLSEPALGTVMLGIAMAWLLVAIMAVTHDWTILSGKEDDGEGDE